MSEFETTILQRLQRLETEVAELKSGKSAAERARDFERLPGSATVGKAYVAYRFGCSEAAVVRGRAGTSLLAAKRVSEKPLKWIKRDVDAIWKEFVKPVAEIVAEKRAAVKPRRRSILTRS